MRGPQPVRRLLAAAIMLCVLLAPGTLAGQTGTPIERVGASDVAVDRRLARLLESDPLVVTADTMIPAGDTIARSVLVLDATVILEGTITGDLVLVDAGAFVRPRSVVRGDLVNVAGGLYRSELARVGGTIIDLPTASYRVVRHPDRIVIEATDVPSPLELDGFMGLQAPTYDRVNGLTAIWGARYRLPHLGPVSPSVHGQVGWQTERGEPTYAASGRLRWGPGALAGGYEKGWETNDTWIEDDLDNSINYLWDGDDFRDYNAVERVWAGVSRQFGDVAKQYHAVVAVRGRIEDAESLRGGEPWHLWGDSARANPAIDPGRTTSLVTSFELEWNGQQTYFEGRLEYEAAREWLDGEFEYDRIAARGDWAMRALADHTLEIEFFIQQPLGDVVMPRQEWSYVGGAGTLQTVEFARYRGDRVVFVESKYIVPMPERVALPLLGAPDLELIHGAGMAWVEGEDPAFQQEVGTRLQFFGLYFRFMIDPQDTADTDLDIGLSWPFGGRFPWQDT